MDAVDVSVVIPTCDRPRLLTEAVRSVLDQSAPPLEIIVVDNGYVPVAVDQWPTPVPFEYIRALPRFGVSQARNLGAVCARGTYMAFLDDDDRWDPDYLEAVSQCIASENPDVVLGNLRNMHSGIPIPGKFGALPKATMLRRELLHRNPGAIGSTTVVRRSVFFTTSGYDPLLTTGQDKAIVLDLLNKGARITRAPNAWVDFRADTEGSRQMELAKHLQGKWRFTRKYWPEMPWSIRILNLTNLGKLQARRLAQRAR